MVAWGLFVPAGCGYLAHLVQFTMDPEMFPSSAHHITVASVAKGSNLSRRRDVLHAIHLPYWQPGQV